MAELRTIGLVRLRSTDEKRSAPFQRGASEKKLQGYASVHVLSSVRLRAYQFQTTDEANGLH